MRAKYIILLCLLMSLCGLSIGLAGTVLRPRQPEPVRTNRYVPSPVAGSALVKPVARFGPHVANLAKRQRDDVLDEAAERIGTSLSLAGAERIRAHINDHVRKRIRIYGQAK
jgi:hypothetical protein